MKRMKWKIFLILLVFLFPSVVFSQQEIKLSDIEKPGETGIGEKQGIVLAENLLGSYRVVFSGNAPGDIVPVLSKEETGKNSFDKLLVLFSGKIYSPEISEPFIFENKSPEELVQMEATMIPNVLEQSYTLYLDLIVVASSHLKNAEVSDDVGEYKATISVTVSKL